MNKIKTLIQFYTNPRFLERSKSFDCIEFNVAMHMCGRYPKRKFYWKNLVKAFKQL